MSQHSEPTTAVPDADAAVSPTGENLKREHEEVGEEEPAAKQPRVDQENGDAVPAEAAAVIEAPQVVEDPVQLRLLMTNKLVGTIIGKGGEKVRRVREEAGCFVTFSDNHPGVVERVLQMTGGPAQVTVASKMILAQLFEDQLSGAHGGAPATDESGEPKMSIRVLVPSSQVGAIIGKGGAQLDTMRKETQCQMQVQSEPVPRSTDRPLSITGSEEGIKQCLSLVANILHSTPVRPGEQPYKPQAQQQQQQQYGGYNPNPQMQYGGYQGMYQQKQQQQPSPMQTTQQFTIANDLVGCVIGRGGTEINSMRQQSGAQIRIHDQDQSSTERLVSVTGSPEQVQMAQMLLTQKLQSEVARTQQPQQQWNA